MGCLLKIWNFDCDVLRILVFNVHFWETSVRKSHFLSLKSSPQSSSSSSFSPSHSCPVLPQPDPAMFSAKDVLSVSEADRLLPSATRLSSFEIHSSLPPKSPSPLDSIPSPYSKSVDFKLFISDRKHFKRFSYISSILALLLLALVLLLHFFPHKRTHTPPSKDLSVAVKQALTFFDAQKSGKYPRDSPVKFRGDSGTKDGSSAKPPADLLGGFYDSGNNMKFTFPTAYAITLLSWSVIEYHKNYEAIDEIVHVKDIIRWGTDYLLKVFVPSNGTSDETIIYSQVGSANNESKVPNDICWQRPEDMDYERLVSKCDAKASDLAGEIVAALSAASLVFREDENYARKLTGSAEKLFELAINEDDDQKGTYTMIDSCGGEARNFYNSTGFEDELIWAGTWLFFATGNASYLAYSTNSDRLKSSEIDEESSDRGIFYWNNKLSANEVLLTRILYFQDLGYPFENAFELSSSMTESLICSYLSSQYSRTPGGLILLRPHEASLQFAATTSFIVTLYSDYLDLLRKKSIACGDSAFSVKALQSFALSQVNYILGDNPQKMSYMAGYGDKYPTHIHHRGASIPSDGKAGTCAEGERWHSAKNSNPNVLVGAMVAGPNELDNFLDERDKPWFTEPSIAGNAGLVAALIAVHGIPSDPSALKAGNSGIDRDYMFRKIASIPNMAP